MLKILVSALPAKYILQEGSAVANRKLCRGRAKQKCHDDGLFFFSVRR